MASKEFASRGVAQPHCPTAVSQFEPGSTPVEPPPADAHPALFLPEPAQQDGPTAVWHVEIDLDRHHELRDHLVNGQPTAPIASLVQIAAEAAVSFAPRLAPVRYTDLLLSRLLRAPAARWPQRIDVTATRTGGIVHVRIDRPSSISVPTVEYAQTTVHLGMPDSPDSDDWHHNDGESTAHSSVIDRRFDGYLLPGDALDALLRTAAPPESITSVRLIDIPVPADDRELARLLGAHVDLRHYSTPDGERYTATTADGTVLARLEGVTGSSRDLATKQRNRTGAKTPGRGAGRTRSAGGARDGG